MRGSFRFAKTPVPPGFPGEVGGAGAPLYGETAPLSSAVRTAMGVVLPCPRAAARGSARASCRAASGLAGVLRSLQQARQVDAVACQGLGALRHLFRGLRQVLVIRALH